MIHCQSSSNSTSNVSSLSHIAAFKPEILHQRIYNSGNVLGSEILIHWRTRGEGISGKRRNNEMVRHVAWIEFISKQLQKR